MIVGFAPGGTADIAARVAGEAIQRHTGQTVVVDSKTGALGYIALKAVANAPRDGYTLASASWARSRWGGRAGTQIPLDIDKELVPLANLVGVPMALIVRPNAPYGTVEELVAYAKANPGRVTYGSTGAGSTNQLGAELFAAEAGGLKLLHVPYRGGVPAIADVATGQIDIFFANISEIVGQISSGQVRALASPPTSPIRLRPTCRCSPGPCRRWRSTTGSDLWDPAGLPPEIARVDQQALCRGDQRSGDQAAARFARPGRHSAGWPNLQGADPEGPRALGESGEAGQYPRRQQLGNRMNAPLSLGIDIGGTFTDLVIHDPRDGRAVIWKESTTPDDPARGALEGTRKVLEKAGARPEQVGRVVHATTLFTNALIERKGAKTGLLTTAGFADVLEIARERKYELYDLFIEMPQAAGAAAVAA